MFNPTEIELGTLKIGKEEEFHFKYDNEVILVTRITSPCGCTRVTNDIPNKEIVVNYKPKDIPIHLKQIGQYWYNSMYIIKVNYINTSGANLIQNLIFTAKIIK